MTDKKVNVSLFLFAKIFMVNPGEKNIIIYVQTLQPSVVEGIEAYEKKEKKKFRIMLIRDTNLRYKDKKEKSEQVDILIECDFTKPEKITKALLPYYKEFYAITCRSESQIKRFAQIIPHVPYLRTPTVDSLDWSTDKLMMRRRLRMYDKKHTPKFTKVGSNTAAERKRIAEKIGFPMVIKPTNLSQSMLVSICYHEEELKQTLTNTNKKINKVYKESGRGEPPQIIAEEYMEGDMYSIDSYVNSRGKVYHCPAVKVITGKNIGHDDFYNYMHITPTTLKKSSVEKAEERVEAAVHALGLRSTTVHAELMKIDDEWRIIEVGPRVGGFRDKLYNLSCDINHTMNDILIRVAKRPMIPKKCKGFAATIKWFPKTEGTITELKGIKKIKDLKSFHSISIRKKVGDRTRFAKNGGLSVFSVTLYNKDRPKLLADIRRLEQSTVVKVK